jgi:hypothetical protein
MTDAPRVEYVQARRALLDALTALRPHLEAVVLIGAQAVYLRTEGRLPGYQPFTTDADLVTTPPRPPVRRERPAPAARGLRLEQQRRDRCGNVPRRQRVRSHPPTNRSQARPRRIAVAVASLLLLTPSLRMMFET